MNRSTVRSGLHVELMTLASFPGHSGLRMVGGGGIGLLTRPCQTLQGEFADQTVIMEKNTVFNGVFFLFFIFFSFFYNLATIRQVTLHSCFTLVTGLVQERQWCGFALSKCFFNFM